jgi:hypothetical protein
LFKPFGSDPEGDIERFKAIEERLFNNTRRYTFADMRALFLHYVVSSSSLPRNLTDSKTILAAFPTPQIPSDAAIKSLTDKGLISFLEAVKTSKIGDLRNLVVHKHAYRPSRAEVDLAYNETVDTLVPLTTLLDLRDDLNHYL